MLFCLLQEGRPVMVAEASHAAAIAFFNSVDEHWANDTSQG